MAPTVLGGRVEASRRTLWVALGDIAMIALFVALGEIQHAGTIGAGLATFVQFGLGWALAAVAAGVYRPDALANRPRAVVEAIAAWLVAALIGQLLRLLATPGGSISPAFVLVSVVVGGLFLGGWRFAAARTAL